MKQPKEKEKVIIEVDETEFNEKEIKKKTKRVLAFSLGGETYCIGITDIKEVIKLSTVTKVPNAPRFVFGLTNLRGEIISILDIRHFFDLEQKEKTKDVRVIITDVSGPSVGILADRIINTIDIEEEAIQAPLSTLKKTLTAYTKGQVQVGNDIFILLDLEKVLKNEEIETLRKGGN